MKYTTNHFSLNLPQGDSQDDLPALLRHLADELEKAGKIDVRDIILHNDTDIEGDSYPSFTVYYDDLQRNKDN